jgi:hypothetical protein
MKWLVTAMIAVAALAVFAAPVSAAPTSGAATPFKASYGPLPKFGVLWYSDCSGARIVNSNTGMVKDSETCLLTGDTSTLVAGTFSGDPSGSLPWSPIPSLWGSDYDGATATHWTETVVDNGDGTWTAYIVAYY